MPSRRSSSLEMIVSVVIVCALSAGGLALTYAVTKGRIAEQDRLASEKALKAAIPGATVFESVGSVDLAKAQAAAGEVPVYGVYSAGAGSQEVGWGIKVGPRGYGGPITMVVGLDRNGKVVGVSIVTMNETPGLGSQIVEKPGFLTQFIGVDSANAEADVKKLDMITGASKSSRGVRHGVEAAAAIYDAVLASGGVGP
jgi:electron transport complex protein RnfG